MKNIIMDRGDTLSFTATFDNVETLDEATFAVKASKDAATDIVSLEIGDGITKVEDGVYKIRLDPTDTAELAPGRYWYKFRVGIDDDVYTVLKGVLTLED